MGDALRRVGDANFVFSSQREISFRRMGDLFAEWATLPNGPRSIQRRQFCCVTVHSAAKFQPNGRCCSRIGDVAAEWATFGAEWTMFRRMGDAPNGRCAKKKNGKYKTFLYFLVCCDLYRFSLYFAASYMAAWGLHMHMACTRRTGLAHGCTGLAYVCTGPAYGCTGPAHVQHGWLHSNSMEPILNPGTHHESKNPS